MITKVADLKMDLDKLAPSNEYLATQLINAGWVKREVGEWWPYYEDVECYNSGGYTERRHTGYICSCCQEKKSFTPVPRKFCAECGAQIKGILTGAGS
jgi:hypothetical protein